LHSEKSWKTWGKYDIFLKCYHFAHFEIKMGTFWEIQFSNNFPIICPIVDFNHDFTCDVM